MAGRPQVARIAWVQMRTRVSRSLAFEAAHHLPWHAGKCQRLHGHHYRLEWRRAEGGGNWYYSEQLQMEGWLCPALLRYFADAPRQLFVQVKPRDPAC